jgi:tetratricopeptide (TPR) repeat protein
MTGSTGFAGSLRRGIGLAALAGVIAMVLFSAVPGDAGDAEGRRAADRLAPDSVVARLRPSGALPDPLRRLIVAYQAHPGIPEAALAAARALGAEAALAVLQDLVAKDDPTALLLAADARQYQHDFQGATQLLDRLLAEAPDHLDARLKRATIRLVRGDFAGARADCQDLTALAPVPGSLCLVSTYTMSAEAPQVASELDRLLQAEGALDQPMRAWALSLAGEIAVMQTDHAAAETALRAALAIDPSGQREAVMLADVLLATDRAAEVPALLAGFPATDAIALRQLRAEALGAPVDTATRQEARNRLAARVAEAMALGLTAHAREEGQFLLWFADDPAGALERAEANWRNQKEFEDALLLLQAAGAAGRPAAADPVRDWLAQAGLTAPALLQNLPETTGAAAGPAPSSTQGMRP